MIKVEKSNTGREKTMVMSFNLMVPEFINSLLRHSQDATVCHESVTVTEFIMELHSHRV